LAIQKLPESAEKIIYKICDNKRRAFAICDSHFSNDGKFKANLKLF
jgi:hypothetical protein